MIEKVWRHLANIRMNAAINLILAFTKNWLVSRRNRKKFTQFMSILIVFSFWTWNIYDMDHIYVHIFRLYR